MTLDKKYTRVIFFKFEFKMGRKAVETTRNISIWPKNC